MRTIVHFLRLDLSSRLLLAVMMPVLVLGVLSVWLTDRHEEKLSVAQAQQTIDLLSSLVVRSLQEQQPVHDFFPPDEQTSLMYVSASKASSDVQELITAEEIDEAIGRWSMMLGTETQPIVYTNLIERTTGSVMRTILPIDRLAAIADSDDPTSITQSGRTLEGFAILETSLGPVSSAGRAYREQLVLMGLVVGFLAFLFGRSYAIKVIANPVEELRCRLGDTIGPEHSLVQSLRLRRWDELGDLSKDLERVRVQLVSDFRESQHALGCCSDSNSRAIVAYQHATGVLSTLMDASEDASLQTETLQVCSQHAKQHIGRLSTIRREFESFQQQTISALEPVLESSALIDGTMNDLLSRAIELDNSIERCGLMEETIRDSAESLDVLSTNLGLLATKQPEDSLLQDFAMNSGTLQRQYRDDADLLKSNLHEISQHRIALQEAAKSSQSAIENLSGSAERAVALTKKQCSASESLVEILEVIQNTIRSVEQSASVISARLKHIHEISGEIGNTTSQTARLAQRQGRLLDDATQAVGRYTVEERAKAA